MQSICKKLLFISKFNNLNKSLVNCERTVNKMNIKIINNKLEKMLKIAAKCDNFDVNEDKQRQCYKQLKCFWPKCRYRCQQLYHHISCHLNKRKICLRRM